MNNLKSNQTFIKATKDKIVDKDEYHSKFNRSQTQVWEYHDRVIMVLPSTTDIGKKTCRNYAVTIVMDYDYYYMGNYISAKEVLELDFSHLTDWIDVKSLQLSIDLFNKIPVMFHHDIHTDLSKHKDVSVYFNKSEDEKLLYWRRHGATKQEPEQSFNLEEVLKRTKLDTPPSQTRKDTSKSKIRRYLKKMGYPVKVANTMMYSFELEHSIYIYHSNLEPKQIASSIDEKAQS
jgi:hypothetical protein